MFPSTDDFEIDVFSLSALRDSAESMRLIDCREDDEFAFNRIEGAQLIPLSQFAELAPLKLIGNDEADAAPVVIYCHHGMRSLQATHFLRQRGLKKVWSMAGGIDAWSQQVDTEVPRY